MHSVYTVEKISECTDFALEILVSVNVNWFLRVLTSISIAILLKGSWKLVQMFRSKKKVYSLKFFWVLPYEMVVRKKETIYNIIKGK